MTQSPGLVTYGKNVYVGTTEGTFYALDQTSGDERWTMTPEVRISAAPAFGRFDIGQGADPMIMVVVDDAGIVRGHDATSDKAVLWVKSLGARIRSSPVVIDGVAMVATTEGFIHGLDLREGDELWKYPDGDEGIGLVSADLTYHEGTLYVGTQEGILHIIDVSSNTAELICEFDAISAIVANPLVVDNVVYVGTMGQNMWTLPPRNSAAARCPTASSCMQWTLRSRWHRQWSATSCTCLRGVFSMRETWPPTTYCGHPGRRQSPRRSYRHLL